jgi:hypothetical protein
MFLKNFAAYFTGVLVDGIFYYLLELCDTEFSERMKPLCG